MINNYVSLVEKILKSNPEVFNSLKNAKKNKTALPFDAQLNFDQKVKGLVSVIIPNYNYSHYLDERINSIINQTYRNIEIIFLDDNSTDNSVVKAKEVLKNANVSYKVICNKKNQGTYKQWLKGIREAKGEFTWIAEADDFCELDFLEKSLFRLTKDGSVLVYTQSKRIDENSNITAPNNLGHTDDLCINRWKNDYVEDGLKEVVDYLFYRNTIPNVSACLFKKECFIDIPDEFASMKYVGDWLLYSHVLLKGAVSYIAEPLNYFRRHKVSVTRVQNKTLAYFKELIKVKKFIIDKYPIHHSQIERISLFINKDYKFDSINKNSEHIIFKNFINKSREKIYNNKRFIFITTNNGSHKGGSEQLWIQTAKEIRKKGHDVMVLIKNWDPAPDFFREFNDINIRLLFKEHYKLEELLLFNPDLVIVSLGDQDEGVEFYEKFIENKVSYVIVNQLTKEPEYWPIRIGKINRVRDGYLSAKQVFFTCENNHKVMEKRLKCRINKKSIHFNPFHLDRNVQIPFPSTTNGLQIAIPAKLLKIHKGQHLAIEVFKQKKWQDRSVNLNLYGEGPDKDDLVELVNKYKLSNVHFYDRTPDLVSIWKRNHAILMPSFMEGFPIVLAGAMISARVPILTDIGVHSEIVDDNINGFIAEKPTVSAIDEALERAFIKRDMWEEIGKKARNKLLAVIPEDPVNDFIGKILKHT